MEMEFDVQIRTKDLYDYLLHHVYTTPSGLFGTIVGGLFIIGFFNSRQPLMLIIGLFIVAYFPWNLHIRAASQANSPAFKEPLHYHLSDEGVEVSRGEEKQLLPWDSFVKAISTNRNIVLYTSKVNAFIFPRSELGEQTNTLVEIVSTHMAADKVRIRGSI